MKNAMQLKAIIKNTAKKYHISAQLVLQNYMLERLLERVSVSKYQQNFIVKGGFLIGAMVGLNTRATMDMDATIKGIPLDEEVIIEMFRDLCMIDLKDDITFEYKGISKIRDDNIYGGFRISLAANYSPMSVPLKLDLTTGDKITPKEIIFEYKLLLEDRSISILSYNLETILAEKIEAIISRGDQSTRLRDYYDMYILYKLYYSNIDIESLNRAVHATSGKRNSLHNIKNYKNIIGTVRNSEIMHNQWKKYQKDFDYAKDVLFDETCDAIEKIMECLEL